MRICELCRNYKLFKMHINYVMARNTVFIPCYICVLRPTNLQEFYFTPLELIYPGAQTPCVGIQQDRVSCGSYLNIILCSLSNNSYQFTSYGWVYAHRTFSVRETRDLLKFSEDHYNRTMPFHNFMFPRYSNLRGAGIGLPVSTGYES